MAWADDSAESLSHCADGAVSQQLDTPNLVVPLASSYNERGIAGFTTTFTSGLDQRKVNCVYRPVANSMTGKTTLYLSRRPGVTIDSSSYGSSGQNAYLVAALTVGDDWVFSTSGNDVRASSNSTTTTIVTAASWKPTFVDVTSISGTATAVLQITLGTPQRVFYASAIGSWTEITDGDFPASTLCGKMEFMDGFAFALARDNRIYNSDINSLANWTAGNYITKQIEQDTAVGLAKYRNQIIAFGLHTAEVFVNAGNAAGSPLQSVKSLAAKVGSPRVLGGTKTTHYYAIVNETLFFVGTKSNSSSKGLFAYNGERFERVSTPFIDSILSTTTVIYSVNGFEFMGRSAVAIGLDDPSSATQRWLMFFPEWKEWFEWSSSVFRPVNDGDKFLGVDQNQHKLYAFGSADNWQDDSTDYTRTVQFKLPKNGNHRKFMRWCGVQGDTARSAQSLNVSFSDDDDQNFSTARVIDRTSDKPQIYRCGSYRTRTVRLTDSGNFEGRIESFLARID